MLGETEREREEEMERMEMTKGWREQRERAGERDGSGTAANAGIIQLGETIGLCLTTVRRGQPHTAP